MILTYNQTLRSKSLLINLIVIKLIKKLLVSPFVRTSHSYPYRITYTKSARAHAAHLRCSIIVSSIYSRLLSSHFLQALLAIYLCISIFSFIG